MEYYTIKVLRFLRQVKLSEEWEHFMELSEEQQILEKGATLVAQWCQPTLDIKWEDIALQLDNLTAEVNVS